MRRGLDGAAAKPPRLQVGIACDADAACAGSIPAGAPSISLFIPLIRRICSVTATESRGLGGLHQGRDGWVVGCGIDGKQPPLALDPLQRCRPTVVEGDA